jgi:hypothetical protein
MPEKLPIGRTKRMKDADNEATMKDFQKSLERDRNAGVDAPDKNTPGQMYYQYGIIEGTITRTWVKIQGTWR